MTETARIADELARALSGDPWHGSPIMTILADVTAEEAVARPIRGAHSIWEITRHLTGWAREVTRRCQGGEPGEPAEGDWPRVAGVRPAAGAWDAARSELAAAHADLSRALVSLAESSLDRAVGRSRDRADGTGTSHYVMLHGVSQHVAYHAGQIALLRKIETDAIVAPELVLRDATDDDADDLIGLIAVCFSDYPGCALEVPIEMPELRAIASAYAALGGRFWVAERENRVVGCVGYVPSPDAAGGKPGGELRKLYVHRGERRRGLGSRLSGLVEAEARARGARFMELWSDTRFTDAHRLYGRLGYHQSGATRELHDLSGSVEYHFQKDLGTTDRG